MLKERLEATIKRVKAIISMALPCGKQKSKVITVGNNNADIDINKYSSFDDAIQKASFRLKDGGTIRLQPGNYQMCGVIPIQKNIIISGTIQEEVDIESHKRKRLPYISPSKCEAEARVANGQYADPFDE